MILANGVTVAVADGETLSLFRNGGHEGGVALKALETPALDAGNVGKSHRSSEAEPDDKTQSEDGYAAASAAWLNKQVLEGKIGPLMVIAAPRTLGELRKHYHKQLEAVLVGELAKDLVGRPVAEIEAAVTNA
jgi:protein required for attachment to host cells